MKPDREEIKPDDSEEVRTLKAKVNALSWEAEAFSTLAQNYRLALQTVMREAKP